MQTAMSAFPWFTLLIVVPLAAALVLACVKALAKSAKAIALAVSVLVFVGYVAVLLGSFDVANAGTVQLGETYSWIPSLGVSLAWGVNGMGAVMIALATFLVPVVILASWDTFDAAQERGYFAWILVLESLMIALFAARDLFLFYILFEAIILPLYFLIGRYGAKDSKHAAMKFLLYSLLGGLIMLIGVIAVYIYGPGGETAYLLDTLGTSLAVPEGAQVWVFFSFFIAFAIKAPMWPLHTWLPDTAEKAQAGTSTLLVGVLDKLGTYGMIAICAPLFPAVTAQVATVVVVFALISIIWGALMAIGSDNLLRLTAYTSVSHFGFMVLAIYSGSQLALAGAILYMVAHGIGTAALFIAVDFLGKRGGSVLISSYGGWQRVTPVLAAFFFIAGMATIALPGLSGFVPEYLVLMGTFAKMPAAAVVAVLGVVLAALYILLPYQRAFTGPKPDVEVADLNAREKTVMGVLIAAMLFLGLAPSPVLAYINPVAEVAAIQTEQVATGDAAAAVLEGVAIEGSDK